MSALLAEYGSFIVVAAFGVMLFAGFVKGTVGFALPMITVSGVGSMMAPEIAVAAVILPSLVTNAMQSLRQGLGPALGTLRIYWRLNLTMFALIGLFAQLVVMLPDAVLFLVLGSMVTVFGSLQLSGWKPTLPPRLYHPVEWIVGVVAGFFGGLAGVWGPPILLYLLARDTPKVELVRAQGISFMIGTVVLLGGHLVSGVMNADTVPFSSAMVVPAVLGMVIGYRVQDRLDALRFRKLTLVVLVLAGLNLLRRGLMG